VFPDPSISAAITATRLLFTAYNGYQKGKMTKSDEALREEVQRRTEEIRSQIDLLYSKAHRNKQRDLRNSLQDIIDLCDQFISDARFGLSHSSNSKHDAAVKMNKKSLKILIEHDFNTLDKLVKCNEKIETIAKRIETNSSESELYSLAIETRTMLSKSQNYFSQRKLIMYGHLDI
tara:strand:- start:157 stop:684 length:528 start_codon:yes stop_codon:yes gene_type:complete